MPSGKKDIYGNKSKALYKAGTITAERAAAANRDPERARRAMEILKREGVSRRPEVIRTTTSMKPTPTKPAKPIKPMGKMK
jgi:hypothetical protein